MTTEPFDLLAEADIPPPPDHFDEKLHERLNRVLVVLHMIDLCLRAIPWAATMLCQPLIAFSRFTFTGLFERNTYRHR